MNWLKKWVLKQTIKEVLTMDIIKGYRTLIVNGSLLLTYLLAWDQLTTVLPFLTPKVVATVTTVVNIVLRFITTTPLGSGEKS